jgi:uncharacterized protein
MTTFSDGERLIVAMLADIMIANDVKGDIDPEFVKTVVFGNDLWALKHKYPYLLNSEEEPSRAVIDETMDILDMCRIVESSINQLNATDLATIPDDDRQLFIGFDGNHDEHYGVALMLIKHLDKWSEFSERSLNSHSTVLPYYHRKLAVINSSGFKSSFPLPIGKIRKILEA